MLRQNGIPVHDIALSRFHFSVGAMREVRRTVHNFRPDIIQAWGHTAQIVSMSARKHCDWTPRVIWSVAETTPLPKRAGFIDQQKLKLTVKHSARVDRIVYTSEASAAHHRRVGFPDGDHETIAPGVDAARFKPDPVVRAKVRENLKLPADAFVIGMVAPFQPEYDHATFLKGIGELIKTNPHLYVLLAGHGVQRGNAPLMALLGGSALATRTQLLGEWSDLASLFNACDLVCSSALMDSARMTLAMAMLCGIPCVATGLGAQGELIGQHGVAIEPGSPTAFIRGIGKILEMPQDKRVQLAHGARKYALKNFVYVSSLQKYLKLYCNLVGREVPIAEVAPAPAPEVEVAAPVAAPAPKPAVLKDHTATIAEIVDPYSLEAKVAPKEPEPLPKWRIEQEQERAKQDAQLSGAASSSEGDVLQIFEMELAKPAVKSASPMSERARGYVEDFEELLSPEVLSAPAPSEPPTEPHANAATAASAPSNALPPAASTTPVPANKRTDTVHAESEAPRVQESKVAPVPPAEATPPAGAAPQRVETSSELAPPQTVAAAPIDAAASTAAQPNETASAAQEAPITSSASKPEIDAEAMPAPTSPPLSPSPDEAHTAASMDSEPKQECLFDFEPAPELEKKAIGDSG